jgi:hypothetical protein
MQQAEVFHIYHHGEQRGPYSARQVNHLYKCGFIGDETLYWRDGMEQWQPITEIVERRRRRRNRLRRWGVMLGVATIIALLVVLFGDATRDAWREMTSGEYTVESAWWRARGLVRENLAEGEKVVFEPIHKASVKFEGSDAAIVDLAGEMTDGLGHLSRVSWRVRMNFDTARRLWQPAASRPEASAQPAAAATPTEPSLPVVPLAPTAALLPAGDSRRQ